MSLDKIDLPPHLVAQLYPRSLSVDNTRVVKPIVDQLSEDSPPAKIATPSANWKSLGKNQQQIMIVVDYNNHLHLPDAAFEFLSQMLNACKLGPNDVAIINRNNYPSVGHQELINHFESKTILLFGVSSAEFGLPFETPPYQVQQFAGLTIMHAPQLDNLKDDKPAKTQLWASFKKIFNL